MGFSFYFFAHNKKITDEAPFFKGAKAMVQYLDKYII